MLTDGRIQKKMVQIESRDERLRYESIADVPMEMLKTKEHVHKPPRRNQGRWREAEVGTRWGGEWQYDAESYFKQ